MLAPKDSFPSYINLTSLSCHPVLKTLKGWCSARENSGAPADDFLAAQKNLYAAVIPQTASVQSTKQCGSSEKGARDVWVIMMSATPLFFLQHH